MSVRDAGHHTAVIEIYNRTVVTHISVFQEQVGEIRTPFLVGFFCCEVLLQPVFEHLMGLSGPGSRLPGADDGAQAQLCVHIFMDGCSAVAVSSAFQIGLHAAVAIDTVVAVVNLLNLLVDCRFLGIVTRLPVLAVVVIGVWA